MISNVNTHLLSKIISLMLVALCFCLFSLFSPILSIVVVSSREEAIRVENSSPYGNAACIYTTVGSNAEWFTSRFHTGHVGVNIGVPVPREPFSFGGWNASRYGDMDITGKKKNK